MFRQGSWTVNCRFTTENVCFFSPEWRSIKIAKYAAAVRTDCKKIARVPSTMYRPEVSRSAQTRKSTQLCVHTHAYLAIKASISARNAANSCSDLLDSSRESASARSWFLRSASLKSSWDWWTKKRSLLAFTWLLHLFSTNHISSTYWNDVAETSSVCHSDFKLALWRKSRPCRGTLANCCIGAQRSTPWLLDTAWVWTRSWVLFFVWALRDTSGRYMVWLHSSNLLADSADGCCVLRNLTTLSFGGK